MLFNARKHQEPVINKGSNVYIIPSTRMCRQAYIN